MGKPLSGCGRVWTSYWRISVHGGGVAGTAPRFGSCCVTSSEPMYGRAIAYTAVSTVASVLASLLTWLRSISAARGSCQERSLPAVKNGEPTI